MRQVVGTAAVVVCLFGAWVAGVMAWHRSVQPAGPTLAEHLSQRPAPRVVLVTTAGGQDYLVLVGTAQPFPKFPSGPPVYVFDRAGQLADWTPDEGDDNGFHGRWPEFYFGREVTRDEVVAWPGGR